MTPSPLTSFRQQIEASFDEKFVSIFDRIQIRGYEGTKEDFKAFISSALTQQLSLIMEEVKEVEKKHLSERVLEPCMCFSTLLTRIKSGNEE